MKLTKNMTCAPSAEARELYLFAENTRRIYDSSIFPVFRNLAGKMRKGIYSPEEAVKLYYYAMTAASDLYNKWYGYRFTVTERWTAAADMEADSRELVAEMAGA